MSNSDKNPVFLPMPCALHDPAPDELPVWRSFTISRREKAECCNRVVKKTDCDLLRQQQATHEAMRFYVQRAQIQLAQCQRRLNAWGRDCMLEGCFYEYMNK